MLHDNLKRVYGIIHTIESDEEHDLMERDPWLYRRMSKYSTPLKKRDIKRLRKE